MTPYWIILLNDRAGAFRDHAALEQLAEMVREAGLEAQLERTASPEEMRQRIRALLTAGRRHFAVAGGDGTVKLAIQELVHRDAILGILPTGTANNFASALHLPQALPAALQVLKDGQVTSVDVGKAHDYYFTEAAGVGLFADILAFYGRGSNKNFFKGLYAILRVLFSFRARGVRLTIDGEKRVERAILCTVANTYRMAHAVPVAPHAKVTDGELDVVVIGRLKLWELLPYYRAIRAQMHLRLPKVRVLKAKEVRIESKGSINVHADDEVIGSTPVTITVQPGALKVMVERL